MIFSHKSDIYKERWKYLRGNKYNGAYYYSKEIVEDFIPNIKTPLNWVTVNIKGNAWNNSIVFVHNNINTDNYAWLKEYSNIYLVCSLKETCERVKEYGTPIYLPLSVNKKYVEKFKKEKTKEVAFVGRKAKRNNYNFDDDVDFIENVDRDTLLSKMAEYKKIYAVGRTAIEGKILGCQILPYDERFPKDIWRVRDTKTAVKELQKKLDKLGVGK